MINPRRHGQPRPSTSWTACVPRCGWTAISCVFTGCSLVSAFGDRLLLFNDPSPPGFVTLLPYPADPISRNSGQKGDTVVEVEQDVKRNRSQCGQPTHS